MRRQGVKLSVQYLRDSASVRGHLSIVRVAWQQSWRPDLPKVPTQVARLAVSPRDHSSVLPELRDARVVKLIEDAFVVVGIEAIGGPLRAQEFSQSWWCRLAISPTID